MQNRREAKAETMRWLQDHPVDRKHKESSGALSNCTDAAMQAVWPAEEEGGKGGDHALAAGSPGGHADGDAPLRATDGASASLKGQPHQRFHRPPPLPSQVSWPDLPGPPASLARSGALEIDSV